MAALLQRVVQASSLPSLSLWVLMIAGTSTLASAPPVPVVPAVQAVVDNAVHSAVARFAARSLQPDALAVTLVDLARPDCAGRGSHRGDVPIYPASVVKLFYLVAAHRWLEDGRLADTPELRRALSDMIVLSYNEATHYVVDLLTDTTSGPELSEAELERWFDRRNAVNRYFTSLGYVGINANKKPWCEGPYGREIQAIRAFEPKRNLLTTDATARLLFECATGQAVTPARSAAMLELLRRDLTNIPSDPDDQARFSGPALPAGAKLWSKAGWTSETRHDAILVELPNGRRFILVIFTVGHANERSILHHLVREVVAGLEQVPTS
ncbi:MAG: class A beta-lactamase-related serine hydrolase [Verrucomicrobia bacterium]|nr:class A beta-lactamase-related serine hydrolase [Verrucomicrobiota bacterium]